MNFKKIFCRKGKKESIIKNEMGYNINILENKIKNLESIWKNLETANKHLYDRIDILEDNIYKINDKITNEVILKDDDINMINILFTKIEKYYNNLEDKIDNVIETRVKILNILKIIVNPCYYENIKKIQLCDVHKKCVNNDSNCNKITKKQLCKCEKEYADGVYTIFSDNGLVYRQELFEWKYNMGSKDKKIYDNDFKIYILCERINKILKFNIENKSISSFIMS